MIIYKTLCRWSDDMEFKNMSEYKAFRDWESAKGRIGTIESELKKEKKILVNPNYKEYIEETKNTIMNLEKELNEWNRKMDEASNKMDEAKQLEEGYGRI